MLSVFFGNDAVQVRQKAFAFLQTLTESDSLVTHITADRYDEGIISDLAGGSSLFGGGQVCVIDTPSEDSVVLESVMESLALMGGSANQFVLIETSLTAPHKKKIQSHAKIVEEIDGTKKEKFNAFSLTDAFLRKDKKSLWLLLMEAQKQGLSNEEIIGVLFWQIKTLRLVERTSSAEEAGQKPFVYSKAKRALSNFKKGELDTLSKSLLTIYHEGHLGTHDTALALEKWVLTL